MSETTQQTFRPGDRVRVSHPDHANYDQAGTVRAIILGSTWPVEVQIDGRDYWSPFAPDELMDISA